MEDIVTPDWQMVFVLPNLALTADDLGHAGLNLGLEGIAIVPDVDERVVAIREWSKAADRFLGSFHNGTGTPLAPAVLVCRRDWLESFRQRSEPIIGFRNAVAMSAVLHCRTAWPDGGWLGASWTDTFDYHPAQLRTDGAKFDVNTPALRSIGFKLDGLALTPAMGLPRSTLGRNDEYLAARLGRLWRLRYQRRRDRRASAKVFRSLEAAYQAASMAFRNYASLTEVGMDAVHWVNSMEVLAMPVSGDVRKQHSVELLGEYSWRGSPELANRRFRRRISKRGRPLKFESLNLVQRTFLYLYSARSKFVHGDRVAVRLLQPFGDERPSLLSLASSLYRTALVAYLDRWWPDPKPAEGDLPLNFLADWPYERHLKRALTDDEWAP